MEERRLATKQEVNLAPKIASAEQQAAKAAMMTGLVDGQDIIG